MQSHPASGLALHSYDVPWYLYTAVAAVLVIYAIIEAWHTRHDHTVSFNEAVRWTLVYVGAALFFAVPIYFALGAQASSEYLAAWAIEKALSLDNLFVIGLIFASFKVDRRLERRMLNYGIAGAIVFRLIFIVAGLELLQRFAWVSVVFGAILLRAAWNAFKEARDGHSVEAKITDQRAWKIMRKILPIHPEFDGTKLITVHKGKKMLTLMAAIIILIELTDVVFAVDSVPAVLAVSPDRFIAYSSNVFALLGLRSLFFVYKAVEDKFWALNWALAVVLAWISFKMIAAPFGFHVPVGISLSVLGVLLGGSLVVSLLWPRHAHDLPVDNAK